MIVKGYRGDISLDEAELLANKGIYIVNAVCVGGREHAEYAYWKMVKSFSESKNIARNKHLELMLILSGKRQIKEAIKLCGVENAKEIAAVSESEFELPLVQDDSVLMCNAAKLKALGISHIEGYNMCDLFFENSAMLELER